MDQDELGNYLLHITAKSDDICTKSQNHEECKSAILIHINLLESTFLESTFFIFMNGNNSERLVMMTVAFVIEMFLISLPNENKFVNSGKRHVTKSSLLQKKLKPVLKFCVRIKFFRYYSIAIYEILRQSKQSV